MRFRTCAFFSVFWIIYFLSDLKGIVPGDHGVDRLLAGLQMFQSVS